MKKNNFKLTFGSFIREQRIKLEVGQRELAGKIGIAASYLNDIEKNKRKAPKQIIIKKISKVLKINLEDLNDLAGISKGNVAPDIGEYDYVLLNGLFTQKMSLDHEEMLNFLGEVLVKLFQHTRVGMQFNFMSPLVDFKRDGAFHLDFDTLSSFITAKLSRKFVIRHDIFPYEYFCIVYK